MTPQRKKIVLFGTFDILHIGHLRMFEEAKAKTAPDGQLTVVVARDSSVIQIKGKKPVFNENERLFLIQSLRSVDDAVLGNTTGSKFDILETLKPDFIVLGYDQWVQEEQLMKELQARGLKNTKVVRLEKYGNEDLNSTTKVLKRVIEQRKEKPEREFTNQSHD